MADKRPDIGSYSDDTSESTTTTEDQSTIDSQRPASDIVRSSKQSETRTDYPSTQTTHRQDKDAMPDVLKDRTASAVAFVSLIAVYGLIAAGWAGLFVHHELYYMLTDYIVYFVAVTMIAIIAPLQYIWGPSIADRILDKYL